jgi:hypothetical protein
MYAVVANCTPCFSNRTDRRQRETTAANCCLFHHDCSTVDCLHISQQPLPCTGSILLFSAKKLLTYFLRSKKYWQSRKLPSQFVSARHCWSMRFQSFIWRVAFVFMKRKLLREGDYKGMPPVLPKGRHFAKHKRGRKKFGGVGNIRGRIFTRHIKQRPKRGRTFMRFGLS